MKPAVQLDLVAVRTGLYASLILAVLFTCRALTPSLRVCVDPDLAWEVDWTSFQAVFLEAGVGRVEVEVLADAREVLCTPTGPRGRGWVVGLVQGPSEPLPSGVGAVDPDSLARLLWVHRSALLPPADASSLRRNLYTNAAVREAWRAVCGGPDPSAAWTAREVLALATGLVPLTAPQRQRLQRRFDSR